MAAFFPRIGIVGSGSVGTYYGARLSLAGANVSFLMRGDLGAVRARGSLLVHDKSGVTEVRPVAAFGSAAEMGKVDLVFLSVKSTSNDEVGPLVRPLLGPQTALLTAHTARGPH